MNGGTKMADRNLINEEELDLVNGGQITYTWNGTEGSLGINGNNPYVLVNKDKFLSYYNKHKDDTSELDIIRYLLNNKIIRKP